MRPGNSPTPLFLETVFHGVYNPKKWSMTKAYTVNLYLISLQHILLKIFMALQGHVQILSIDFLYLASTIVFPSWTHNHKVRCGVEALKLKKLVLPVRGRLMQGGKLNLEVTFRKYPSSKHHNNLMRCFLFFGYNGDSNSCPLAHTDVPVP